MPGTHDHGPRPWRCTRFEAIWCPHCGDCTCGKNADRDVAQRVRKCPLHGEHSDHPTVVRMVT